jgi:hypothetical protein
LNLTPMQSTIHVYEVCPRKDQRGVDLSSDVLPFGRLWFSDNPTQSKTAAWDRTTCGSLSPLWGPVVSDQAQAASVFADKGIESPRFPSLQYVMSVASASASYDVLQRLQVPNFDA